MRRASGSHSVHSRKKPVVSVGDPRVRQLEGPSTLLPERFHPVVGLVSKNRGYGIRVFIFGFLACLLVNLVKLIGGKTAQLLLGGRLKKGLS